MTATSDLIESLISYSWDDWQVTRQEARRVIAAIRNDNVPDATIAALDKSGSLIKLFQRVGPPELARSLIASIAGRTTMQRYQARNALIRSLINNPLGTQTDNWIYFPTITFFDICADLADAVAACFLFMLSGFPLVLDAFSQWAPQWLLDAVASLSLLTRFDAVSKGVIDLRDLLYFVSLIVAWLAATAVAVDLKKAE